MKIIELEGSYSVCKTANLNEISQFGNPCFIGVTATENSLLCRSEFAPLRCESRDDGWKGFYIDGQLDFSLIGILAKISGILAECKIGILAVSTYDTDYVFVKEISFESALQALQSSGYDIERLDGK